MKISVLIPCFNGERWIAQCLDNVMSQTWRDLEVIVIDDGSTDRTAEIVSQNYPSVRLVSQANQGVAVARNRAIEEASGEYFHFMDVDDLINVDFYERMVAAVEQTGADMAFCGLINEARPYQNLLYTERFVCTEVEDKYWLSSTKFYGYSWRYLCRRELVVKNNFRFPEGQLLEDIQFTIQAVYHAGRIVTVPGAVYYYKMRPQSTLNKRDKAHTKRLNKSYKFANEFRNEFLASHGLSLKGREIFARTFFRLFGIPILVRRRSDISGNTQWFLFGLPVFKSKNLKSLLRS